MHTIPVTAHPERLQTDAAYHLCSVRELVTLLCDSKFLAVPENSSYCDHCSGVMKQPAETGKVFKFML